MGNAAADQSGVSSASKFLRRPAILLSQEPAPGGSRFPAQHRQAQPCARSPRCRGCGPGRDRLNALQLRALVDRRLHRRMLPSHGRELLGRLNDCVLPCRVARSNSRISSASRSAQANWGAPTVKAPGRSYTSADRGAAAWVSSSHRHRDLHVVFRSQQLVMEDELVLRPRPRRPQPPVPDRPKPALPLRRIHACAARPDGEAPFPGEESALPAANAGLATWSIWRRAVVDVAPDQRHSLPRRLSRPVGP